MNEKTHNVLNKILTVVVILLAALCVFLAVKIIGGKDTSIFGYQVYHIMTGSMEPTIPTGSTVITKQVDPYELEVGDVITFTSRDSAIYGNANTHRIIGIDDSTGERKFITKGDANGSVDSMEVSVEDVKGKVVFHANFKAFSLFWDFMRTGYGFITVIVLPFIFILWHISKKLKEEIQQYARETAEKDIESDKDSKTVKDKQTESVSDEFERLKAEELARLKREELEKIKAEELSRLKAEEFEKLKAEELERLKAEISAQSETKEYNDMKNN